MPDYADYTAKLGAAGNSFAATNIPAAPTSFVTPVESAHASLAELVARLENVAQRLCGAVPPEGVQTAATSKLQSVPSGLFEEIAARGHDMTAKLARGHDLIGRIEHALPF